MDIQSLKAELSAIQAKLSGIVDNVKSANRELSPAEVATIETDSARAIDLKSQIQYLEKHPNGSPLGDMGAGVDVEVNFPDGLGGLREYTSVKSAKGFLTPGSLKATAQRMAGSGLKALVADGTATTPVALDSVPLPLGQAGLGLLSLIPTQVRDTPKYSHLSQTVRTNNAAEVAPGATKPTSVYTVASVSNELKAVAHLSEYIDKYVLRDNADLEVFLTNELRNGIVRKVTSLAVSKFSTASGIQTQAFVNSAADSIYLGLSKITSLGYNGGVIVIPTDDYDAIRLSKDENGQYYGGNVFDGSDRRGLWGVATLASPDLASGTALVLGAGSVGISTDKAGIETEWDTLSHFDKNELRARTEARFGYDVFTPEAIVKVTTAEA